jgi:hypothetical protein
MSEDLTTLEVWRDSLPAGHQDKPGAIRACEVMASYGLTPVTGRRMARIAADRRVAHDQAIGAYNAAQHALRQAEDLVRHLEAEVERTLAACQSFMPPKDES